jgi:tRNA threonylcarbamoyladenosine biosynthesis protein TsaE
MDRTTLSAEQTKALGASFAALLEPGDVVSLSGDLGAGKTVFVQGACEALGVHARVQSPSFVLVREYAGERADVVHADAYRLGSLQELIDLGYEDLFSPDAVLFIEWGDAVDALLPEDRFSVRIAGQDDQPRVITIDAPASRSARLEAVVA